ncbi:hypothetical protein [Actinokineospora auranticolor]|uniref:hypothetical protein n=1 Tax=Actinokineospora auranticolor TaxID=155976 RepID=UPI003183E44B
MAVFLAALVLTAAGIVVPKLIGAKAAPQVPAGAAAPPGVTSLVPTPSVLTTTSPLPTRLTSTPSPTSSRGVAPAPALEVVRQWAEQWVNHDGSAQEWLARLRPYMTEEYAAVMASVDPANVLATKVTGPVRAEASFAKSVEAEVPTDQGTVHVTAIETNMGWKVAAYEQGRP